MHNSARIILREIYGMKALQIIGYGEPKKSLAFADIEKPTPKPNEVLIKVHAAGLNPIDFKMANGDLKLIQKLTFPSPIGFDLAGIVTAKGSSVSHFKTGDKVYSRIPFDAPGSFAEWVTVDANAVAKKPSGLTFVEAASLPLVALTTIQALSAYDLSNKKVFVHAGSGGVGSFAIQYAKMQGAEVWTTTSTANVEWVKALGVDHVIDYTNDIVPIGSMDIVFDTLGGRHTLTSLRTVKPGGHVVSIAGELDAKTAHQLKLPALVRLILAFRRRSIMRIAKQNKAQYRYVAMQSSGEQLENIRPFIENKSIQPVIDQVFTFDETIAALIKLKNGRAKGKIVVQMR